jgi:hypothetical protein
MKVQLAALLSLSGAVYGMPAPVGMYNHILDLLPRQGSGNITCPPTPSPMPKAAAFPSIKTMPDPFLYLDGKTRVQSKEEWYACRQPEILKLLQEYQYGYYPDHSQETVTATRSGNRLDVSVAAGGKTATISATVNLPSGSGPFPAVIAIGGIDNRAYTNAGIAVVTFDYGRVAADSNSKSGAFWTLYNGKDIGKYCRARTEGAGLTFGVICRCTHSLGLGFPPRPRRHRVESTRNRRKEIWCDGLFAAG